MALGKADSAGVGKRWEKNEDYGRQITQKYRTKFLSGSEACGGVTRSVQGACGLMPRSLFSFYFIK
jgi:hypothetical protein